MTNDYRRCVYFQALPQNLPRMDTGAVNGVVKQDLKAQLLVFGIQKTASRKPREASDPKACANNIVTLRLGPGSVGP